jgi:hypothetical protein
LCQKLRFSITYFSFAETATIRNHGSFLFQGHSIHLSTSGRDMNYDDPDMIHAYCDNGAVCNCFDKNNDLKTDGHGSSSGYSLIISSEEMIEIRSSVEMLRSKYPDPGMVRDEDFFRFDQFGYFLVLFISRFQLQQLQSPPL